MIERENQQQTKQIHQLIRRPVNCMSVFACMRSVYSVK